MSKIKRREMSKIKLFLVRRWLRVLPDAELKAGVEWYERFEKELDKDLNLNDVGSVLWDSGDVMRAAKRASGIKDE